MKESSKQCTMLDQPLMESSSAILNFLKGVLQIMHIIGVIRLLDHDPD